MDVVINVYDLHEKNDLLYQLGLGMYHSGVVIGGREWSYASGAGIYPSEPKTVPGFRESIRLGVFNGQLRDLDSIIDSLRRDYHGGAYHMLDRNCNSFSEAFVFKLLHREIPGYINRMAFYGSIFSCLLPQDMTGQAPVGDTNRSGSGSGSGFTIHAPGRRNDNNTLPTTRFSNSKGVKLGSSGDEMISNTPLSTEERRSLLASMYS